MLPHQLRRFWSKDAVRGFCDGASKNDINAVSPSGKKDRQQPHVVPSGGRHGSTSDIKIDFLS